VLAGEAEVVFGVKVRLEPTWISWFNGEGVGKEEGEREGLELHGDGMESWS
jgi:hypothetical protein